MLVRVNRKISALKSVEYAALLSGTISHVWHDEVSEQVGKAKRRNHIIAKRDTLNPKLPHLNG